jgi:hypothetical protein
MSSFYKSTAPYSYAIKYPGYGYNHPMTVDQALTKCFMSSKEILEILAREKETKHNDKEEDIKINKEDTRILTEEEKLDLEAQISEEETLDFETYEISDQIVMGFNSNLDKMTESQLQTMLLKHKQYPYTRLTQHNVICWNKWKIEQIKNKIAKLLTISV